MKIAIPKEQYTCDRLNEILNCLYIHLETSGHELYLYDIDNKYSLESNTDVVFIWNGSDRYEPYIELKLFITNELKSKILYCEHGWMPQKDTIQVDSVGVNCECSWANFEVGGDCIIDPCIPSGEDKILIPLQNEEDTQILYHSPKFKTMESFVKFVLKAAKSIGKDVVIRKHPRFDIPFDVTNMDIDIDNNTEFKDSVIQYKYIAVINSTVGFECIDSNKIIFSFGKSLYNKRNVSFDCSEMDNELFKILITEVDSGKRLLCKHTQSEVIKIIKNRQITCDTMNKIDSILLS